MVNRIAIYIPGINIYGQEKALLSIAKLLSCNYKVIIFGHEKWGKDIGEYCLKNNLEYFPLISGSIWSYSLFIKKPTIFISNLHAIFKTSYKLISVNKLYKIDVLLTGNSIFTFYALIAIKICKIKLIFRAGDELPRHNLVNKLISYIIIKSSKKIFCNCFYLRSHINNLYKVDSSVIRNIISHVKIENIQNNKANNRTNIIYVGQLTKEKGLLLLLEAISKILKNRNDISFTIIGSEPGYKYAKNRIITNKISKLLARYPNNIMHNEFTSNLYEFYSRADIHVCPSVYNEPSANVIFEAKAHSLPSIIFNVGGLPELIKNEVDGLCSSQISSNELVSMIIRLADNIELRKKLSLNAFKSIDKDFNQNAIKNKIMEIISEK